MVGNPFDRGQVRDVAGVVAWQVVSRSEPVAGSSCDHPLSWTAAGSADGSIAALQGPIVNTGYNPEKHLMYLNIGSGYPDPGFVVEIPDTDLDVRFAYRGRNVCVQDMIQVDPQGVPRTTADSLSALVLR